MYLKRAPVDSDSHPWGAFLVAYVIFQISRDLIPAAYEHEKTRSLA